MTALGYNSTNINFDTTTTEISGTDPYEFWTVTAGNVNYISHLPIYINPSNYNYYGTGNALAMFFNQDTRVALPGNTYAFGFEYGEVAPNPLAGFITCGVSILFSTVAGEVFAGSYQGNHYPGDLAFIGFLSDTEITSLVIDPMSFSDGMIDNFTFAQASVPVPEPSTFILFGVGLVGIALMRREKKLP